MAEVADSSQADRFTELGKCLREIFHAALEGNIPESSEVQFAARLIAQATLARDRTTLAEAQQQLRGIRDEQQKRGMSGSADLREWTEAKGRLLGFTDIVVYALQAIEPSKE